MSMRINTNVAAMNAYRNLSVTEGSLSKSLEKLSSGFRINRAADDAAGLAISEGLRSQVGGLKVATRNAQDGISVVQTAEGALTETHAILQRMRDLAVQSANGSNDENSRGAISAEADQLKGELTRISDKTSFNGVNLLDGSFARDFQIGHKAGDVLEVSVSSGAAAAAAVAAEAEVFTSSAVADFTAVNSVTVDGTVIDTSAATDQTSFVAALNANTTFAATYTAAASGTDKVTFTASTAGAKTAVVTDLAGSVTTAGADALDAVAAGSFGAGGLGVVSADFSTATGATAALGSIDTAIKNVSTARANLGAVQNRFEHTIKNLNVAVENLSASESRIRDTDMAAEMVDFTKNQILQQAGTAMLAQANQSSQGVLSLLR